PARQVTDIDPGDVAVQVPVDGVAGHADGDDESRADGRDRIAHLGEHAPRAEPPPAARAFATRLSPATMASRTDPHLPPVPAPAPSASPPAPAAGPGSAAVSPQRWRCPRRGPTAEVIQRILAGSRTLL